MIGTGFSWAISWGAAGAVLHGLLALLGSPGLMSYSFGPDVFAHTLVGFISGAIFSGGILIAHLPPSLRELPVGRSAAWGAVAGFTGLLLLGTFANTLPLLAFVRLWPVIVGSALFGAGTGAAMIAVAKQDGSPTVFPERGSGFRALPE